MDRWTRGDRRSKVGSHDPLETSAFPEALPATLPELARSMGIAVVLPLLERLQVTTFASLLSLDLTEVARMRSVGSGKLSGLRLLRQACAAHVPWVPSASMPDSAPAVRAPRAAVATPQFERPPGVDDLVRTFLEAVGEGRARTCVERHVLRGESLRSIGDSFEPPIAKEAVGSQIASALARHARTLGQFARTILAPAIALIEQGDGLAPAESCLQAIRATDPGHLILVSRLAGTPVTFPSYPVVGLATRLDQRALAARLVHLDRSLRVELGSLTADREPIDVLKLAGMRLEEVALRRLATVLWGERKRGDGPRSPPRGASTPLVEVLRLYPGPMSPAEIRTAATNLAPEVATMRLARVTELLRKSESVLSPRKGQWIHELHVPISADELERMARRALEFLPESGASVRVSRLREALQAEVDTPPHLTDYMLREALLRTGAVRSFGPGCEVMRHGAGPRQSHAESLEEAASTMEQPFQLAQLLAAVRMRCGADLTVLRSVMRETNLLNVSGGDWIALSLAVQGSVPECRSRIRAAVPLTGLIAADALWGALPDVASNLVDWARNDALGPRIVWGLARTHHALRTANAGLAIWRAAFAPNLYSAVLRTLSPVLPAAFTSGELQEALDLHLARLKCRSWNVLTSALQDGSVRRVNPSTFALVE